MRNRELKITQIYLCFRMVPKKQEYCTNLRCGKTSISEKLVSVNKRALGSWKITRLESKDAYLSLCCLLSLSIHEMLSPHALRFNTRLLRQKTHKKHETTIYLCRFFPLLTRALSLYFFPEKQGLINHLYFFPEKQGLSLHFDTLQAESILQVIEVGDCARPRKIHDAIHEGHLAPNY